MNKLIQITSSETKHDSLYLYGNLIYSGFDIPSNLLVNFHVDNFAHFFNVQIENDWLSEKDYCWPEKLIDIPTDAFIEYSDIQADYEFLSSQIESILESSLDGWDISDDFILHTNTGCYMSGPLCEEFLSDRREEYLDSVFSDFNSAKYDLSCYEILEPLGFSVDCESPLNITDSDGNQITGECAHFVLSKYRAKL